MRLRVYTVLCIFPTVSYILTWKVKGKTRFVNEKTYTTFPTYHVKREEGTMGRGVYGRPERFPS